MNVAVAKAILADKPGIDPAPLSQRLQAHAAVLTQPAAFLQPGDVPAALADICVALTRVGGR